MAAELIRKALIESEKYEMQRSYGVKQTGSYDFKDRQESYYVELLCRMYELLCERERDYQSKDKCRTFQINPDRSYVDVKCSDSTMDFVDAWDENV